MNLDDVITFAKENPVCAFATIEGDQPRVRGFLSVFFEDNKIYFTTAATKNVCKQLSKNPKMEIYYSSKDFRTMMRITGSVEFVNDLTKKQKLIEEKPYLKGFKADDPMYILLRVAHGKARFWTLENNMRENELPVIEF